MSLQLFKSAVCLILFALFALARFFRCTPNKTDKTCVIYHIMERSGEYIALRNPSRLCWLMGVIYAGLFYWSLPVLIWRYGKFRSICLILFPIIISLIFSYFNAMLGLFFRLVFIALTGLYVVVVYDLKFREQTLLERGWVRIRSYKSSSSKEAIDKFLKENDFEAKFNQKYGKNCTERKCDAYINSGLDVCPKYLGLNQCRHHTCQHVYAVFIRFITCLTCAITNRVSAFLSSI